MVKQIYKHMEYNDRFKKVSVLGAGGKMGSGILLLTAMEMFRLAKADKDNYGGYSLMAIDLSEHNLRSVLDYLRGQITKAGEKQIVQLRKIYNERKDLIENGEIIQEYVRDVLSLVNISSSLEAARGSGLIFEAVSENPELKVKLIRQIEAVDGGKSWYLTNTSSIPIGMLDKEAGLTGRIIGFHFYNPPAVQKLVELITAASTLAELRQFSLEFSSAMRKKVVPANDVAGFIGNGHFMRDILFALAEAERLTEKYTLPEAVWILNRVTQDFLIRPMGIFQLSDYVGLDVCSYIMQVMNPYMEGENLHAELIERLIGQGVIGGQHPDGSQKNGILSYEKGRVIGVWDPDREVYVPAEELEGNIIADLGELPEGHLPWKSLVRDPDKKKVLDHYFRNMNNDEGFGSKLALAYGRNSGDIGRLLVDKGVAASSDDVNTVLLTGFFHAYGPVNEYFN